MRFAAIRRPRLAPTTDAASSAAFMNDLHQLIVNEIPRLRRYARFLLRNPQAADDLVQDTLVRAVAAVDSWQPDSNMRAWLFTIMKNVMRNDFRRAKNADIHVGEEIDNHPATAVDGNQEARVALADMQRALNDLPAEFKQVVLLCAVEGFQYEEVAAILNIPVGTVRSRLSRGRAALRVLLAGGRGEDEPATLPDPGTEG
jgi:RNA polymerase sigma-70 factor (ECF subfamily)